MNRHLLFDRLRQWPAIAEAIVVAAALFACGQAHAQELGHYGPALPDVRDLVVPGEPGFYFKQYAYYYAADRFQDRNGETVSTIPLPGGATVNLDVDVGIYVLAPTFMWVSEWEILGARYAAYVIPTFGNSSVGASLSTTAGRGISGEQSDFAQGDPFRTADMARLEPNALGLRAGLWLLCPRWKV